MTDLQLHEQLDETNRRLLREMHADPRLSMSELGRRVGLSAPAVSERVQRLQRAGVITGFRMDVDPAALGLPVAAYVRLRPAPGQLGRIAELAVATEQVSECAALRILQHSSTLKFELILPIIHPINRLKSAN